MRNIKIIVKLLFVLAFLGIYSFSNFRNSNRTIKSLEVKILGEDPMLISNEKLESMVLEGSNGLKDIKLADISLGRIENKVGQNGLVEKVNAYLGIEGNLVVEVEQRKPILRVVDSPSYYIDSQGRPMPLSSEFSVRVPLYYNKDLIDYKHVYPLAKYIREHDFYRMLVTGIIKNKGEYFLNIRGFDFELQIGTLENLEHKLSNFMAFYQWGKNGKLDNYQTVSLKYNNQVMCK